MQLPSKTHTGLKPTAKPTLKATPKHTTINKMIKLKQLLQHTNKY
jgi:hypothetical protein